MKVSTTKKHFGSDNYSGVHPRILEVINDAGKGHVPAYGNDIYTKRAEKAFKKVFGNVEVFFVFNGTAANVLSLSSALDSFEAVICSERAHIHEDEGGAPEKYLGAKLIPLPAPNGKINVRQIHEAHRRDFDQHRVQTRVVSITQCTEYGTLYELEELREISRWCKKHDHIFHVDGARIANAAVSLGTGLREACGACDVLSFGATKNGLMLGEAVVFFNKKLSSHFKNHRKQAMQLMSKMRFASIQLETYLLENLWLKNATQSNKMAKLLRNEIKGISEISVTQEVQANAVFAKIPKAIVEPLSQKYNFYVWREISKQEVEVRWMTSFDTTEEDVRDFANEIKVALNKSRRKSKS